MADLGATEALLTERGVSFGKSRGRLRIAASEAFGVVIEFSEFSAAHAGPNTLTRDTLTRDEEAP